MELNSLELLFRFAAEFSHRSLPARELGNTEYMICSFIAANSGCSQEDAAKGLRIDKTTVGKALQTLEEKGCITRARDNTDRRVKRLELTEEGRARVERLAMIHRDWLTKVFGCLTQEEQSAFDDSLRRLLAAAEELSDAPKGGAPNAKR